MNGQINAIGPQEMNGTDIASELNALAFEIERTEKCSAGAAYIRASRRIDDLIGYVLDWDRYIGGQLAAREIVPAMMYQLWQR